MNKENILIAACLLGINCRYNAKYAKDSLQLEEIEKLKCKYNFIPICPEQLGGLSTPRLECEIVDGDGKDYFLGNKNTKVFNKDGKDVTYNFIVGAQEALKIATICQATKMITQTKSPSCSKDYIYDGTFSKTLKTGHGFTAALLNNKLGIEFFNRNEIKRIV